jgi:hypothetical protein
MKNTFRVVIPAYQRSEKLLKRCEEILSWQRLRTLVISVDGPRAKASKSEIVRRENVIKTANQIAKNNAKVDLYIWDDNRGVNIHTERFIKKLLPQNQGIIVIEDDVSITSLTLDFLADNHDYDGSKGAAGHVFYSHNNVGITKARRTLFPYQWGQAISYDAMEIYTSVIGGKPIMRKPIRKAINVMYGQFFSFRQIESLTQWWFNHFFFCMRHGNWADALVQYSVMAAGGHYRVPAQSLVIDDSTLFDERAITPRVPVKNDLTCFSAITQEPSNEYICTECELANSHLRESGIRNLLGATKHRRFLQFKETLYRFKNS